MSELKYKVGDKVRIKDIGWYNENKNILGNVECGDALMTFEKARFCGKIVTISNISDVTDTYGIEEDNGLWRWTDEMIECLVERNGKTYPYKIGDRVVLKGNNRCATITDLKYNSWGNLSYYIKIDNDKDISIDYPTDLLLPYDNMIEEIVDNECPQDFIEKYCRSCGTRCDRTKEYLNGCPYYNAYRCKKQNNTMEEETKPEPKFKVGDILFYRGETSGYLKVEEIREENGEIRYYETSRNIYLVENDPDVFADKVCSVETEETKSEDELLDEYEELTDRAFKGGYEKCKSDIELNGFQLPEGYQFVDEDGSIINATKIVLEKKRTVEEKYSDVKIQIFGNVVILKGGINADNPTEYMNEVVHYILNLLGNPKYNQFIEDYLDNPWVRILIFDFNSMEFNNSFDDIVTNFKRQ